MKRSVSSVLKPAELLDSQGLLVHPLTSLFETLESSSSYSENTSCVCEPPNLLLFPTVYVVTLPESVSVLYAVSVNEFFEMTATNNRLSQYDLEPQVLSFNKLKEDSLLLLFLLLLQTQTVK